MTTPVMVARNPDVSVWVDGVQLPDGCLTAPADSPTALTGLTVTWGRDSTIDQPAPATASLEVMDAAGGQRFRDVLAVGARLDVRAQAQLYLPPSIETLATPLAFSTTNGTATAAGRDITAYPADGLRAVTVTVYPLPLSTDPTAWDSVPRTSAGQSWGYAASIVDQPAFCGWDGSAGTVEWVALKGPSGKITASGSLPAGSGTFVPPEGAWLGLRVRWWPTGPTWAELDGTTWAELGATPTWAELAKLGAAGLSVLAPAVGAVRDAMVFSGRITDLLARYDLAIGATVVRVTAQDETAELANRAIGDQPWSAEPLIDRWNRIITLAGQATNSAVAASVQSAQVTYRDVDNQPAYQLLAELARSVDGVLWSATHISTGPVLVLEAMADRPALMRLELGADNLVHIVPGTEFDPDARGIYVSACSIELEPVQWSQDIADVATRVAVSWKDQTLNNDGQPAPTDRTETEIIPELEAEIGVHRVQLSTQRTTAADAQAVAGSLLGRLSQRGWTVRGLEWDIATDGDYDSARLEAVMDLLDGTSRLSLPIILEDLPEWSPVSPTVVPLFLEGGKYTSTDGEWLLDLHTSSAMAVGTSVRWNELPPEWAWNEFAPDIRWADLAGASV